jgi:hypothetical protein
MFGGLQITRAGFPLPRHTAHPNPSGHRGSRLVTDSSGWSRASSQETRLALPGRISYRVGNGSVLRATDHPIVPGLNLHPTPRPAKVHTRPATDTCIFYRATDRPRLSLLPRRLGSRTPRRVGPFCPAVRTAGAPKSGANSLSAHPRATRRSLELLSRRFYERGPIARIADSIEQ